MSAPLLTRGLESRSGSAVDPLAEEVTWAAWTLAGASPRRVTSDGAFQSAAAVFDRIVEVAWLPGRVSLFSEIAVSGAVHPELRVSFAVGVMGSSGSTFAETAAISDLVTSRLNGPRLPYRALAVDPLTLLDVPANDVTHAAVVRQRELTVEAVADGADLSILSRFNPTMDPWSGVAHLLMSRTAPTRVRATVLPTEVTISDRIALEAAVTAAHAAAERATGRPDLQFQAERAVATLVDLRASFATPVLCSEVAVTSSEPLPLVFLRSVGSQFTSEVDVIRRQGHSVVAAQRLMVGGFDISPAPDHLLAGHREGLPVRGGLEARELRDLLTLFESPVGWPIPVNEPVPTVPTTAMRQLTVPVGMSEGLTVGVGPAGVTAHLPAEALERHVLVTGTTGTGKTTFFVASMLDRLRTAQPFLFIDLHGQAADRLMAHADELGVPVLVIDAHDGDTGRVRLTPRLEADGSNLDEVESAASRFADAIASRYENPEWSGPRWLQLARALALLTAAHGAEVVDVVGWLADRDQTQSKTRHGGIPSWAQATLSTLHAQNNSDAAGVRDWLTCKLTAFASSAGRRIFAPAGEGDDLHEVLASGVPVIVNLSALSGSDAAMAGHLIIATVLETAMQEPLEGAEPFTVFVDEAHRFPVASMERVVAEGRKFGVSLALATQSLTQFDPSMADIVSGAGVKLAFRQSPDSANRLAPLMDLDALDLVDLPDLHAYVKVTGHSTCSVEVDPYAPMPAEHVKAPLVPVRGATRESEDGRRAGTFEPHRRPSFMDEWTARQERRKAG